MDTNIDNHNSFLWRRSHSGGRSKLLAAVLGIVSLSAADIISRSVGGIIVEIYWIVWSLKADHKPHLLNGDPETKVVINCGRSQAPPFELVCTVGSLVGLPGHCTVQQLVSDPDIGMSVPIAIVSKPDLGKSTQ